MFCKNNAVVFALLRHVPVDFSLDNICLSKLLLKRYPSNHLHISVMCVVYTNVKSVKIGAYGVCVTDKALFELILYVQYQPQHYNFVELARKCFEEKMNDAVRCRRRTAHYECCLVRAASVCDRVIYRCIGCTNLHSLVKNITASEGRNHRMN